VGVGEAVGDGVPRDVFPPACRVPVALATSTNTPAAIPVHTVPSRRPADRRGRPPARYHPIEPATSIPRTQVAAGALPRDL
jgi:hypothetical protein